MFCNAMCVCLKTMVKKIRIIGGNLSVSVSRLELFHLRCVKVLSRHFETGVPFLLSIKGQVL